MNHPLLLFIILGLAASFLPLQFGYEIHLLGDEEHGPRSAAKFMGGITLFRVFLILILGLIFTGVSFTVLHTVGGVFAFGHDIMGDLRLWVTSGQNVVIDILLIICGIMLVIRAYRQYRQLRTVSTEDEGEAGGGLEKRLPIFLLGFVWVAISSSQWLFILVGANQILSIADNNVLRLILALVFLLLTSLMILLPFAAYIASPERVGPLLESLNTRINSTLAYVFMGLFVVAGIYVAWIGTVGLLRFLGLL
ncbi:MAG: GAP family protein [Candidatus Promineifilaceae bacterium]|jgi:Sap, sulfolipid-1-addressing protein